MNEFIELLEHEAEAVMVFGGVPAAIARDLARSLSDRIMRAAGGDSPYIPCRRLRRLDALADLRAGMDTASVARKHGVSRRTVQRWMVEG